MADQRLKDLRGPSRREFLRWSGTLAAVIGLERARFLDALSGIGGSALADTASCASTNRSIHFVAGNGGFAHFTLVWPHVEQATVNNGQYSFQNPGSGQMAGTGQFPKTDKPWAFAAESPFQKLPGTRQMTAFMAGNNETHTSTPQSAATIATGTGMIAAIAAIQQANPTLLPVIGINPIVFGSAPGAPSVATVPNAAGLVGLFDSVASKTLLSTPSNAALNEAYYKAFLGLNAAAGRASVAKGYEVGKVAANLLGQNLATQLKPTPADDAAYGINAGTPSAIAELAHGMCTALKAFKLGLTSSLIMPAFRDDPHGMFSNGTQEAQMSAQMLGKILDAFMTQAASMPDPACSSKSLADSVVLTAHGDTPKDPYNKDGWGDGTSQNSNMLYVFGNGYLKTGWLGQYKSGSVTTFDPQTGNETQASTGSTATAAAAAAAYAVAKGDMRRVQDFYRGTPITGIVNIQQL
jgi:hypothetical protein